MAWWPSRWGTALDTLIATLAGKVVMEVFFDLRLPACPPPGAACSVDQRQPVASPAEGRLSRGYWLWKRLASGLALTAGSLEITQL